MLSQLKLGRAGPRAELLCREIARYSQTCDLEARLLPVSIKGDGAFKQDRLQTVGFDRSDVHICIALPSKSTV
jgi:hypothetical protein